LIFYFDHIKRGILPAELLGSWVDLSARIWVIRISPALHTINRLNQSLVKASIKHESQGLVRLANVELSEVGCSSLLQKDTEAVGASLLEHAGRLVFSFDRSECENGSKEKEHFELI
jgi:hypothetical protein